MIPSLREHLERVQVVHNEDLRQGGGAVYMSTTMIYTHVLRQGGAGMKSPLDY